ncbi:MAG: hypothetical protein ACJZ4X_01900 [Candidatus Thalassarchaeaceae archaeon]
MLNQRIVLAAGIVVLIISLSLSPFSHSEDLQKQNISMGQFGGGGTFEAQCSQSSFEDVFTYTWAEFNVTVADNWRTAQINAMAWVNGTMADDFRTFLDDLLDGLVPSGGDGWLSSDEREAVRSVAADCVEYTMTRVGVRDGEHHRGGAAVDWRNATWVEDGVSIDEWNMVPDRHSSVRDCSSFGSSQGCYEIPVVPNSDRDCDSDSESLDECRIELYLSGEVDLHNIQSLETLTLAMNVSNISRATYTINAPYVEGMRLSLFEECEGRDLLNGGSPTPIRGSCIGDGSSSVVTNYNGEGGLTLEIEPSRPNTYWPSGEDLFFDLTTIAPPVDNPPSWTPEAPENGSLWVYGIVEGDVFDPNVVIAEWGEIAGWFTDDMAVSKLNINCYNNEEVEFNLFREDRSIRATIPDDTGKSEFICSAVDLSGQQSAERSFMAVSGFTVSSNSSQSLPVIYDAVDMEFYGVQLPVTDDGVPRQIILEIGLSQNNGEPIYYENAVILQNGEGRAFSESSSNLIPGAVNVWFKISGDGLHERVEKSRLIFQKIGDPPIISILNSEWVGTTWSMSGMFGEPDGEDVSFSMLIDGNTLGNVDASGNSWSVGPIDFALFDPGEHTVTVRVCDASGMCSSADRSFDSTEVLQTPDGIEPPPRAGQNDEGGLLPFPGSSSMIGILAAAFMYRRGARRLS